MSKCRWVRRPQFHCYREHHDREVRFDVEGCPLIEWITNLTDMHSSEYGLHPRAAHLCSTKTKDWFAPPLLGGFDEIFNISTKLVVSLIRHEQILVVRKLREEFQLGGSQKVAVFCKIVLRRNRMPQSLASD